MSTTQAKTKIESKKQGPVTEIRIGRIKAAIWANETDSGIRHNVTICRLYRDGEKWLSTQSFGRDDLPLVMKVSDQAHTWIFENTRNGDASQQGTA